MTKEDVSQAIAIEVSAILMDGWTLRREAGALVVTGPTGPDFLEEVWRIARFVAYNDFVSIEREEDGGESYKVTSRSFTGLAFELLIRSRNSAVSAPPRAPARPPPGGTDRAR